MSLSRNKQKRTGDQDFIVVLRARNQKRKLSKSNATWDKKYFPDILEILRNLQNNFNIMSTKVSREISNQNDNVQRVEIRDMDSYIQSMKDSEIGSDVSFLKILLKSIEPRTFI